MKPTLILGLALVLAIGLAGCSTAGSSASGSPAGESISPKADKILRRVADYYEGLHSFEGTNVISDESPSLRYSGRMTGEKQFAFVRPNKFLIGSQNTNESQLFCDGRHVWDYKPYYFNSYTVIAAPPRFEDAVTNWIGGELLRLMASTNVYQCLVSRFGDGLDSLRCEGEDVLEGTACDHLLLQLKGSKTAEVWVATGKSPFIVRYSLRFPNETSTNGFWVHTETIAGWKANHQIPFADFTFVPPAGAIEQPAGADQVEFLLDTKSGETKIRFYSPEAK